MISDKYERLIIFGEEADDEEFNIIRSSLGFYEINLPPTLHLFKDRDFNNSLGNYVLPKEIVGQTFEGIIQAIILKKIR